MSVFQLSWVIENDFDGYLVRHYLQEVKGISRRIITDIKFHGGQILVNGNPVTVRFKLTVGDHLVIHFPPEVRSSGITPEKLPLHIAYEDDYVLVINKAPYMATIPSREHPTGTLAQAVIQYYEEINLQSTFHAVNRLDRNTSGLLLIAKHRYVHYLFSKMQKQFSIRRTYQAVVHGKVLEKKGTITAPIGRNPISIIERMVREDGQKAVTHYKVEEEYSDKSLVTINLETGRTHQIRVHMAYLGHPLLGDDLYGGRTDVIQRHALHSRELQFFHPFYDKTIKLKSPLPMDMSNLLLSH